MNCTFEDIRIGFYDKKMIDGGYTFKYTSTWKDLRGTQQSSEQYFGYWDMHNLIISMGEIKIKNYIEKNFDLINCDKKTSIPVFKTKEEAEKCYEWLKQKVFETTLIGKENLQAEQDRKREENKVSREIREKNKAIRDATEAIEKFQQYIGKEINFPMTINNSTVIFKTTFLDISFNNDGLIYIIKTEAGTFQMYYKSIEIKDNEIVSLTGGYYHEPRIAVSGKLNILF